MAEVTTTTVGEAQVAGDLACIGCGYNLRTLAWSGVCPECARAVRDSEAPAGIDFRTWRGVCWTRRGIGLMALAVLLPLLAHFLFLILTLWMLPATWDAMRNGASWPAWIYRTSGRLLGDSSAAGAVLVAAGVVAIALPHFARHSRAKVRVARTAAVLAIVGAVAILSVHLAWRLFGLPPWMVRSSQLIGEGSLIVLGVATVAAWIVLARRVLQPNPTLAAWLWALVVPAVFNLFAHVVGIIMIADARSASWSVASFLTIPATSQPGWLVALGRGRAYWDAAQPGMKLLALLGLWTYARVLSAAPHAQGRVMPAVLTARARRWAVCLMGVTWVALNAWPRRMTSHDLPDYFWEPWMAVGRYEFGWPLTAVRWLTPTEDEAAFLAGAPGGLIGLSGAINVTMQLQVDLIGMAVDGVVAAGVILGLAVLTACTVVRRRSGLENR